MNAYFKVLAVILLTTSAPNIFASISCSKPKLSKPVEHKSMYHFKAVVTCNLVGETINIPGIKDAYRSEILSKDSQFVVHSQQDYDNKKGMKGYSLDVTQTYDSENGHLVVRANILLLDDSASHFTLNLKSKSVDGQDNAKYNKLIINEVDLQHTADDDKIVVTKEIDVEQPWYAPQETFFDTVQSELADSIRKSAMLQARKIRGDNVDALRK